MDTRGKKKETTKDSRWLEQHTSSGQLFSRAILREKLVTGYPLQPDSGKREEKE